jgi:hypothetical protein
MNMKRPAKFIDNGSVADAVVLAARVRHAEERRPIVGSKQASPREKWVNLSG